MGDRLALLCRVLNRWKERPCDFVPEQEMGVPGISVSAVADGMTAKRYIDGRYVQVFPFAIRLVISGRDAREMVDALSFFDRCTDASPQSAGLFFRIYCAIFRILLSALHFRF